MIFQEYCEDYDKLPHILPTKKIICLGDLHTGTMNLLSCLKLANVINDDLNWVAEPGIL